MMLTDTACILAVTQCMWQQVSKVVNLNSAAALHNSRPSSPQPQRLGKMLPASNCYCGQWRGHAGRLHFVLFSVGVTVGHHFSQPSRFYQSDF